MVITLRATVVRVGDGPGAQVGGRELAVIAGPCSVEGGVMLRETALAAHDAGAGMLRGGTLKPRTSVALLAERVALARDVGAIKRATGLPRLDPAREAAVVRHGTALARGVGLDEEEVREILWRVVGICRRAQEEA